MSYQIHQSDIRKWAAEYDGEPYHALFCDPPYHLTSITRRFGGENAAPAKGGDVYRRASRGFMNLTWDGGDLAFNPETWAALAAHVYPGAFGLAFASSRGWHRMAVAIEDAGLIIHPTMFLYAFGSGFPKATRINTGEYEETETVERLSDIRSNALHAGRDTSKVYERRIKKPTGKAAKFAGHRYGLQALKPAVEPIILFQKPYAGRPVDSIVETGAGTLWIDGGRIEAEKQTGWAVQPSRGYSGRLDNYEPKGRPVTGRWPSNLILQHHESCNGVCHPECPVKLLDEQSGRRPGGSPKTGHEPSAVHKNTYGKRNPVTFAGYDDDGTAARFFFQADWQYEVAEQLLSAEPLFYTSKPSVAEREAGLAKLPKKIRHRVNAGGLENEPRFAPTQAKNHHPTVKPISLNKYLATILLPPAVYAPRRILVPFAGSGSEMIGAILAGWDDVVGIEQGIDYVRIAEARLDWWSQWPGWGQTDIDKILKASGNQELGQLSFI